MIKLCQLNQAANPAMDREAHFIAVAATQIILEACHLSPFSFSSSCFFLRSHVLRSIFLLCLFLRSRVLPSFFSVYA